MSETLIRDNPMAGAMLERLFDNGVEVVVLERSAATGILAGYGPFDVELDRDPRILSNPLERSIMGLDPLEEPEPPIRKIAKWPELEP
jgi:hypothetical protein